MNLRIEGQQLRFRISKEELEILCSGSSITQTTCFTKMRILEISITPQDMEPALSLMFDGENMMLALQKKAAENLYRSLPSREGIHIHQMVNDMQTLTLILEVDIHTQKRKRSNHAS